MDNVVKVDLAGTGNKAVAGHDGGNDNLGSVGNGHGLKWLLPTHQESEDTTFLANEVRIPHPQAERRMRSSDVGATPGFVSWRSLRSMTRKRGLTVADVEPGEAANRSRRRMHRAGPTAPDSYQPHPRGDKLSLPMFSRFPSLPHPTLL